MGEEIKVFKINTGEEIITRVTDEDDVSYTLDRPRVVAIAPNPQTGQMSVTLIPLFAVDQDGQATIYKSAVVGQPHAINEELEKGYIHQTTGIALA